MVGGECEPGQATALVLLPFVHGAVAVNVFLGPDEHIALIELAPGDATLVQALSRPSWSRENPTRSSSPPTP